MKRKWAYLGALFPLSTAASAWATGIGAYPYDESNKLLRPKNDTSDQDDHHSDKHNNESGEDGAPGIHAPSDGAYGDDGAGKYSDSDLENSNPGSASKFQVSVPDTDSSMYAPAAADAAALKEYGGGGGGTITLTSAPAATTEISDPAPTTTPPEETGYVEPDPVDEHAMLILLGGMATGEGENAWSSGEVVFDVVDYGPFTIGYGYAIYAASGESAEADTFFSVYGADLVFTYSDDKQGDGSDYSATYVLAIDFEGDLNAEQYPGLSSLNWIEMLAEGPFAPWLGPQEGQPVSVKGNIGDVSFTAEVDDDSTPDTVQFSSFALDNLGSSALLWLQSEQAGLGVNVETQGIDTLASVEGSLLEIEDHFSSVNSAVTVIA